MRDPAFEQYLETLSRLLKLSTRERAEIRRELAAHVEEFIEDQLAHGATREEAVRRAIEDFGDAAALAARFHHPDIRKRWLMRGTAAAACVGFAVFTYTFLGGPSPKAATAGAANPAAGTQVLTLRADAPEANRRSEATVALTPAAPLGSDHAENAEDIAVETALQRRVADVHFENTPFNDVVQFFQQAAGITIIVYWRDLQNAGIDGQREVSLVLKDTPIERALRLALDQVTDETEIDFAIRDGLAVIASSERLNRRLQLYVYDVRDLMSSSAGATMRASLPLTTRAARGANAPAGLSATPFAPPTFMAGGSASVSAPGPRKPTSAVVAPTPGAASASPTSAAAPRETSATTHAGAVNMTPAAQGHGVAESAAGMSPAEYPNVADADADDDSESASPVALPVDPEEELVDLVTSVVNPPAWDCKGGNATIRVYKGALIVRASSVSHRELRELLRELRKLGIGVAAGGTTTPAPTVTKP